MSAPDYFAAHALSEHEQFRLQGLELTWDPITHRRLLAAGVGDGGGFERLRQAVVV